MVKTHPRYLRTHSRSELKMKADRATALLANCNLCPRKCGVDRLSDETGYCHTGKNAVVASYDAHFGEEAPLVGQNGSGTIFFTHCSLGCNFCQNYDISHQGAGVEVDDHQLAEMMLSLQKAGCHNINFVTPTYVVPQILAALCIAVENGLIIPLIYNSSGYDSTPSLAILDNVIDIYMPDFKFWGAEIAEKTCHAADYPKVARKAVMEMHRQVGDLNIDMDDLARQGLLVRHLVLPQGLADTFQVMAFIATRVSASTYVNIMRQYRPCGCASQVPALARAITDEEFNKALRQTANAGITRLDKHRHTYAYK